MSTAIKMPDLSREPEKETTDSSDGDDLVEEWKANRQVWLITVTLVIVSIMVSLDATVLVPVLPVCIRPKSRLYGKF